MSDASEETDFSISIDLGKRPRVLKPDAPIEEAPKRRRRAPGEANGTRRENDAYDTDYGLAKACVEWVVSYVQSPRDGGASNGEAKVLEPTAGKGPFVKAVRTVLPDSKIVAIDIRPECGDSCREAGANLFVAQDVLTLGAPTIASCDLIITNPPFKSADALVRHFYANMKPGSVLAFLLNCTFIGSTDRWRTEGEARAEGKPVGLFLVAPLAYRVPIVPRPSFIEVDGKRSSAKFEAELFVWVKTEPPELAAMDPIRTPQEPIRWEKEKR